MSLDGYYGDMLRYGLEVLDEFAEDTSEPVLISFPPRMGRAPKTVAARGTFDERAALQVLASTGIKASFNGVLYIRAPQTPEDLKRSAHDGSIPVGYRFRLRGRDYRCIKAEYARGEYAFTLSDLNEVSDGG